MSGKLVTEESSFKEAGTDANTRQDAAATPQNPEPENSNSRDAKPQGWDAVLPHDPQGLNPSQKGPAQPSDNKTNPT